MVFLISYQTFDGFHPSHCMLDALATKNEHQSSEKFVWCAQKKGGGIPDCCCCASSSQIKLAKLIDFKFY